MNKYCFYVLVLFAVLACNKTEKTVDFKGVWVEKQLLAHKDTNQNSPIKASKKFAVLFFDRNDTDSVQVVYADGQCNKYFSQYAYHSHFIHFDKNKEYYFLPDFETGELVFSNLKNHENFRFVKLDSSISPQLPVGYKINIDSLIQTVR